MHSLLRYLTLFPTTTTLLTCVGLADTPKPPARPNILWVVSEDNSANYVGVYGDPLARTPNLDRLAAEGIVFDHAYSTSAVCAPTRASIITGMYAPSLGTQHMRSNVPLPEWLRYFPAYLRDAGYFTSNHAKTDYNAEVLPGTWNENSLAAHWRHRRPGQPFFSVFNFNASHESSLHKRLPLKTNPALVRVPTYLPDTPEVRADLAQYYDRVAEADRQIGEVLAELTADGLADDTIVFYYADHGGVLPRSKRFLYKNGTHPPLIIYFPEKFRHLAPPSSAGRVSELVNWVDLAPTVLSLAGVQAPAFFQGRALAGSARGAAPEFTYMFRDRMDERYDMSRAVTDGRWRYIRNYRPELPNMQTLAYLWKMSAMREWDDRHREKKLDSVQESFFEPKPPEQLFDCAADPDNVRNLATDPAHRDVLLRLRAANRAHLFATHDSGFMPEAMLRRLAGPRSPTVISRDDTIYPLARLIDLVDQLQLSAAPPAKELAKAVNNPLAVVRYWAAQGALRASDVSVVTPLLADPDPSVRLAAAFATLRRGAPDSAWPVFASALTEDSQMEVRLEALDYLAYSPPWPESLRPALIAASKEKAAERNYLVLAAESLLAQRP